MAAIRRDITTSAVDAGRYVEAVTRLKAEPSGLSSSDLGIAPGPQVPDRALSTWDLFVIWHVWAMDELSSDGRRNAAHMGPVFLPWHRWYLLVLERQMRRVLDLGPDDFGLPYWNWAADGTNLSPDRQRTEAAVWAIVGGDGRAGDREVVTGPFTSANGFRVNVEQGPNGRLRAASRGLRRRFGVGANGLPRSADVAALLLDGDYDRSGWDTAANSFRNRLEGWVPSASAPAMHNRVHVWVGGDMSPGSSPNDPVFFLNHCYVDKVWDDWRQAGPGRAYQPTGRSAQGDPLFRHRSDDPLHSILTRAQPTVASMENVAAFYTYA